MLKSDKHPGWQRIVFLLTTLILLSPARAETSQQTSDQPRQIDVVIALDVSNSMDGLIDSAKQRLWDIVNELGRAQPQPVLRMAILSYGNPRLRCRIGFCTRRPTVYKRPGCSQ